MIGGGIGMGGPAGQALRSFREDNAVTGHRLAPGTIQRIAAIARGYSRELVVFLVVTVLGSAVTVAVPVLAGRVVNAITGGGPDARSTVVRLALVIAGLAFVSAGLSLVERYYSARIGEGLIFTLRSRVFDHVQRMPLAFFTRTQTGALVSRLNSDVIGAQRALTGTLAGVVSNVVQLLVTVGVMVQISWQITGLSLVLLPLFVVPAQRFGRWLSAITRESYDLNAAMNNTMTERFNVSGALLVKLFGRPDEEARDFSSRAGRVRDIGITSAMYSRAFLVALTLVTSLATAAVYGIGGVLALSGQLNPGEVVTLALLLTRLYGPLTALSSVQVDVMSALVSFERVFEVLDLPPAIDERPDPVALPREAAAVEFDAVDFRYPTAAEVSLASLEAVAVLDQTPNAQVLHDVSFRIAPGELVALVGPSGAGKTTISQLLPRMYDVSAGAVRIGGVDIREASLASLRDAVGVVTQDAHMFHTTIRENLLYARPDATDAQLYAALRGAQVADLVASLPNGLDTVVGDRGYRLSGGEKQRLAIARLLLKQPGVVVLDEATAHLDSESEVAVQAALKAALVGRTSLVIAHRLSTVREADQILVVSAGRVVERGRHEELLARGGLYAELYRTQFAKEARASEPLVPDPAAA